jgi:hypothetical protein
MLAIRRSQELVHPDLPSIRHEIDGTFGEGRCHSGGSLLTERSNHFVLHSSYRHVGAGE